MVVRGVFELREAASCMLVGLLGEEVLCGVLLGEAGVLGEDDFREG